MTQQLNYIDIFAGCGGISLGLYNAGLTGIFAIEKHPDAFLTLKHNLIDNRSNFEWPEWLPLRSWDIDILLKKYSDQLIELRGQIDLIAGGPPCQGFSVAGQRRNTDQRNKLIHSYLKFVELIQPRVIIFENVRGFTFRFPGANKNNNIAYAEIAIKKVINNTAIELTFNTSAFIDTKSRKGIK